MCNLYRLDIPHAADVAEWLQGRLFSDFEYKEEIGPRANAPMLLHAADGQRELAPARFGLIPFNAQMPPKQAYNNTRIESVDKWPWRIPFERDRCVVPISAFREPCYWGEPAGQQVYFSCPDEPLLIAAAIYTRWTMPDGATILTMSLLLRPAITDVMDNGHHRMPFFIEREGIDAWLGGGRRSQTASKQVLKQFAFEGNLEWTFDQSMRPDWTGRAPDKLRLRDNQMAAIQQNGPLGFK